VVQRKKKKKKKFRYIYKITCTKGSFKDKFYFGKHTTSNLDDGYKGSGRLLHNYYIKYPDDYIKEIICFCDSEEELNQLEYSVIHPYLGTKMCLNLCDGGNICNWRVYATEEKQQQATEKMLLNRRSYKGESHPGYGKKLSEETKNKISEAHKGKKMKPFTEEHKRKLSEANKGKHNVAGHVQTEEEKRKRSQTLLGHKLSDESKLKISMKNKGNVPPNKGKHMVWNEDHTKFHYE
jgi:hypothetical protein